MTRPSTAYGDKPDSFPQPALGLASIAAVLEKKVNVLTILDGNFCEDYMAALRDIVLSERPDIVGFSVFTSFAGKVMAGSLFLQSKNS